MTREKLENALIALIPILAMFVVWFTPLAFVPVPWPDDSAFYSVTKELFKWPPHYLMLAQAPFEPTYRIFNFNTMPIFPILLGIGRWFGLSGSFGLKFWSLAGWALSGTLTVWTLLKRGLPIWAGLLLALLFSLDPELRWASVVVRPESLIGLCGVAIVLGLSFGFPERFKPTRLFDPIAALLAIAAYLHFNAIHLVFPVVVALALRPKRLFEIGWKTALYLSPWALIALLHLKIFIYQMKTQFGRLAIGNPWLDSPSKMISSIFQSMGSPDNWTSQVEWASIGMVILFVLAVIFGLVLPLIHVVRVQRATDSPLTADEILAPSAAWMLSGVWLWNSKPEVWFTYYMHLACWVFAGMLLYRFQKELRASLVLGALLVPTMAIFAYADADQLKKLARSPSWNWTTYEKFVDCVDEDLTKIEAATEITRAGRQFQVWCPTFPDITVELSRRHPSWDLTRTNDFWERVPQALQHARDVDAVTVTETLNWAERNIHGPAAQYPQIISTWMTWKDYFLVNLWREPGWKPTRSICQVGRWQAFTFSK